MEGSEASGMECFVYGGRIVCARLWQYLETVLVWSRQVWDKLRQGNIWGNKT